MRIVSHPRRLSPVETRLSREVLVMKISAAPRRFDRGNVDFLHAHHGLECALCFIAAGRHRFAFGTPVRNRNAHVDQNRVPNNLLVNEPSLSTQGIGGRCGRQLPRLDAASTFVLPCAPTALGSESAGQDQGRAAHDLIPQVRSSDSRPAAACINGRASLRGERG